MKRIAAFLSAALSFCFPGILPSSILCNGALVDYASLLAYLNNPTFPVNPTFSGPMTVSGLATLSGGIAESVTAGSTETNIQPTGITTLGSSAGGSAAYTLSPPTVAGEECEIISVGASTGQVVTSSNATITSSFGSSGATITFTGIGQAVRLYAQTTGQWMVGGRSLTPVFG